MEAILIVDGDPEMKYFRLEIPRHLDIPKAPMQEELTPIFGPRVNREHFRWLYKGQVGVSNREENGQPVCIISPQLLTGKGQAAKFDELVGADIRPKRLAAARRLQWNTHEVREVVELTDADMAQILARIKEAKRSSVRRFCDGMHMLDFNISTRTVTRLEW